MKNLLIIGASGYGRVCANIAKLNDTKVSVFWMMIKARGGNIITLLHPDEVIAEDVLVGEGSVVMAGTVINSGTVIRKGCIINTSSSVDHDCRIGDFVHVVVGAHVAGTVEIGSGTWVGAGATVSNNIEICSECMIGVGAVVVNAIKEAGTYIGIPAKKSETV